MDWAQAAPTQVSCSLRAVKACRFMCMPHAGPAFPASWLWSPNYQTAWSLMGFHPVTSPSSSPSSAAMSSANSSNLQGDPIQTAHAVRAAEKVLKPRQRWGPAWQRHLAAHPGQPALAAGGLIRT